MPTMPPTFRPAGQLHRKEQKAVADKHRGSARARGYTAAWDRASAGHLRNDPLCGYCALVDDVAAAELTDHLYPHGGDQTVFWNRDYWVSSCKLCHDGFKQRIERRGVLALDNLARQLGLAPMRGWGGSKV